MDSIALYGSPGSPYTRKMLALLRYRRISYRFLSGGPDQPEGMPRAKVSLLPTFYLPDSQGELEAVVDSTPIIRRLEQEYPERSVVPSNPVLGFLDLLLEDYADEWLTKAMFHFRWWREEDISHAARILPLFSDVSMEAERHEATSKMVRDRQVDRLYVVGSNETTCEVIESSYTRFLELLEARLGASRFLLGERPASADFAVFGQLTQLVYFDPTPARMCQETSPRVRAWVSMLEDLSGLEPVQAEWMDADQASAQLGDLLSELGRVYVPVLLANAEAIDAEAEQFETEVDGAFWTQRTFPYQAKCLQWLRQAYARIDGADRELLDELLSGTGSERLFN